MLFFVPKRYAFRKYETVSFRKNRQNNSETVTFRKFLGGSHSKLVKLLFLATPGCAGFSSGCQGIAGMT